MNKNRLPFLKRLALGSLSGVRVAFQSGCFVVVFNNNAPNVSSVSALQGEVSAPYFSAGGMAPLGVSEIRAEQEFFCALRYGDLYCWGSNLNEQLGLNLGSVAPALTPTLHTAWP